MEDKLLPTTEVTIQVRYSDIDAFGHVSNVVYPQYLELARVKWLMSFPGEHIASVVVNMSMNFTSEIRLEDDVHIFTRCVRVGNKSIHLEQAIYAEERRAMSATTILVGFDARTRTTVPLFTGWQASPSDQPL